MEFHMKNKLTAILFVALLTLAAAWTGRAQPTDCYDIQCPSKILAPCEGVYGAHVWFSVTASNRCNPDLPPTIHYSILPGSVFPPGTNVVCATIQIPGLAPRECCFEVIVDTCCSSNCIDVLCPRDIVVPCQDTSTGPGAIVVLPKPEATNYCGDHVLPANLQWRSFPTVQPGQPTYFPPGTNTITWCLTDGQGFTKCCSFNVIVTNCPTVVNQCEPRLECPKELQIQCEGPGGAIVFFPPPKIADPCGVVIATNSTHQSGQFFPNGKTTVVICIVWVDPATGKQNMKCCSFDVVVRCCPTNCVSTLLCPTNVVVECPGPNGVPLNYSVSSTSNCGPTTIVCDPPPGSIIFGPTNVCCRLLGATGALLDRCCFPVLVKDSVPPKIECPTNITVVSSNCGPVAVPIPVIAATDDCDADPTVTCNFPATGNVFPCGVTTITCTAKDASGNTASCSFTITVICLGETEIRCPEDIFVKCAPAAGVPVTYTVYATNRCTNIVSIQCNPPSGTVFPPGSHPVCCVVEDGFGVKKECCFKVTVTVDDVPPTIQCPSNIVLISQNCTPLDFAYHLPPASDNCQLEGVACNPPSGSLFPVGVTTVTCCAWDKAGNTNCCSFTVTVRCPTNDCAKIVCPSNVVVECASPNGAPVVYNAYATNYCTGGLLPVNCSIPSGANFPPGLTTVCCTNVFNGSVQWCCFDVRVVPDIVPPVINCPTNMVVISPNCTPIDVQYPAPTATDNCKLDKIVCTPPSGSAFPVGTTTVTCCAYDVAGNQACCTFTVTVRCPPTDCVKMVCPSNIVVRCAGPNGAPVTYNAYATNYCTGGLLPVTCSRPSGSFFPPGISTVCCTNITAGVVEWCCFEVDVRRDIEPPVINCPTNIFILCAKPNGTKVPFNVTAIDNCDPTPTITCVPPSGSHFGIGCTNVTCVAVDDAGNASTCSFKVCVLPQGCYLRNPSFELLAANLPAPLNCGDPINFAAGWTAVAGTPDLFRPPWASIAPGNCRGQEKPCQGTNYAGLEGGYTATGGFVTEAMMGTLVAPLNNGQKFRLRACLSLAESSPGPVFVEFVLANSGNPAQQQVIHQVWVTQKNGWQQYMPPCFTVPQIGNWDRLIIRMAQVPTTAQPYKTGYVYVDNVNICCCKPILHPPTFDPNGGVVVTWDGPGRLQAAGSLSEPMEWHDVDSPVVMDPETGLYSTRVPRSAENRYFQLIGADDTINCDECAGGGGGAGGE